MPVMPSGQVDSFSNGTIAMGTVVPAAADDFDGELRARGGGGQDHERKGGENQAGQFGPLQGRAIRTSIAGPGSLLSVVRNVAAIHRCAKPADYNGRHPDSGLTQDVERR